jgi:RHS repeat-associated protein
VIQERDANNLPMVSYTRGTDLSGSRQAAGGSGGMLGRTDHSTITPTHAFYHADGNGNITALLNDKQLIVARYEYDPFGNILFKSGPLAEANTYRFSSQEYHQPSGLSLYLYRAYDPNLQRFVNRDPIEELGGINLYAFVYNSPLNWIDPWGLEGEGITNAELLAEEGCGIDNQFTDPNTGKTLTGGGVLKEIGKEIAKESAGAAAGWIGGRLLSKLDDLWCSLKAWRNARRLAKKGAQEAYDAAVKHREKALDALRAVEEAVDKRLPTLREAEKDLVKAGLRHEPDSRQVDAAAEALEKIQAEIRPFQDALAAARRNWQEANEALKRLGGRP